MSMLKDIIYKLLDEVDPDIKEIMLKKDKIYPYEGAEMGEAWELLMNPALTIIEWQRLRDEKIS